MTATYPGATAEALQNAVAAPLEEQINGVEGMLYMASVSTSSGVVTTTITFEVGTDVDQAATNVANRVRIAEPRLPEEVRRLGVSVQKSTYDILQLVVLTSPGQRYDEVYLSNYASLNVVDALKRVPGVGDVVIFGARDYAMRVWMRPDRMAEYGLTADDIAQAVREQNQQFAVGKVGQVPSVPGLDLTYTVTAEDRLTTTEQFEDIVLRADETGKLLRLADVARTELGARDYGTEGRFDGQEAIFLGVFLQSGANALATADGVEDVVESIAARSPAGIFYEIPFDITDFVEVSIEEVLMTLFEALLLVLLVVFLFLQSFRATLIPMIAIPVSLIGTFAGLYALGFTINTLTLFGLVLSIGIVVDDAIVVLENTERIMRSEGKSAREAAFQSMSEVTGPVVAMTLVACSVFIPVAFLGGLTGELYRQFAITLSISVLISGLVALTLSPALCALILKRREEPRRGLFGYFNRGFEHSRNGFLVGVRLLLSRPAVGAVIFAAVVVSAFGLFRVVPGSLVPSEDQGYFITAAQLPDGATLDRTRDVSERIETFLLDDPAVAHVGSIVGFDFVGGGSNSSVMTMFVMLNPWDERTGEGLDLESTLGRFFGMAAGIREAVAFGFNPPPIEGLGVTGGFEVYVQDQGEGNTAELAQVSQAFLGALNRDPRLAGAQTLFRANSPQINVQLDREKAKALGVPVNAVYNALQASFGSLYVNDFNRSGRVFQVQLQADAPFRARPDDLTKLFVRSEYGAMVPLGSLLHIDHTIGAETLERFNLFPSVKIFGAPAPGRSSAEAIAAVEEIAEAQLPPAYGVAWTGTAYQEKETGGSAALVVVLGIVFVFLVLAALYERWSLPVAVLLAVPFAFLGALLAVWLRGMPNDVYFQIGLVTLIGLSAKTAILIVEFADQERRAGRPVLQAAVEAARLRFRPILMTALTFALGVLPLAISTGAGSAARRSMGTGVLGGMLVVTLLAVFFVPLFFRWVSGRSPATPQEDAIRGSDEPEADGGRRTVTES